MTARIAVIVGLALLATIGLVAAEARDAPLADRAALVAGSAPLVALVLALALPEGRARFTSAGGRLVVAALVVGAQLVPALGRFDPYAVAIVGAGSFAALAALAEAPPKKTIGGADLAVWLLLWIPFDLRWTKSLWLGDPSFSYAGPALAVTALALAGWGGARELPDLGWRPPRARDVPIGLVALVAFGALAIPAGLVSGFLRFPPKHAPDALGIAGHALVNGLTVAVPEEVFFRGVLDSGLRPRWKSAWPSLAVSSLAFGLMHWNNEARLANRIAYVGFASVAGVFYGLAYRRSGGLPAAILCHCLVDVIWSAALK